MKSTSVISIVLLSIFLLMNSDVIYSQEPGSNCNTPFNLCDGFSNTLDYTAPNSTVVTFWYKCIVIDPDYSITISIEDDTPNPTGNISLAELNLAVFGFYNPCSNPCSEIQNGSNPNYASSENIFLGANPVLENVYTQQENDGISNSYTISPGNTNMTFASFPCYLYIAVTSDWNVPTPAPPFRANYVFDTESISCEWPTTEIENPYGLCTNYYSLSPGTNQSASFPTDQNGPSEIWFSGISNGPSGLSLNIQNVIAQSDNPCSISEASIELYGPIQVCDDPCTLIENLELSPAAIIPLTLSNGEFTYQPPGLGDGQYLFKLIYDADCEPCNLNLEYDLSNAVADWPAEDEFTADCEDCLPSTFLVPNKSYVFSVWVKQDVSGADPFEPWDQTYTEPTVALAFNSGATIIGPYNPSDADPSIGVYAGPIIEGWQLMEITFITPSTITDMNVELSAPDGPCFFDDIRLFPKDGSMKSYVYDPQNLRFVAELDERHFATLYEYDEEGRLMRIKKETERGIMTIQESKTSTVKR